MMSGIKSPYEYFSDNITLKQSFCLDGKSGFKRGRPTKEMNKLVCDDLKAQYAKYVKEAKNPMKEAKKTMKEAKKPKVPKKCSENVSLHTENKLKVSCKYLIQNKKTCKEYINPFDKKKYCYSK